MLGVAAPRLPRPRIVHGIITNLNDMEEIWHRTFYNDGREAGLYELSRGTTPISTVEIFSITAAGSEKTLEGKRVSAVGR